jgi:hypothetical protein
MTEARRQDPQFQSRLPRVAAFKSRVRRGRIETHVASNDFLDQPYGLTNFFALMTPRTQRRMRNYGWERQPGRSRRERLNRRRGGWGTRRYWDW